MKNQDHVLAPKISGKLPIKSPGPNSKKWNQTVFSSFCDQNLNSMGFNAGTKYAGSTTSVGKLQPLFQRVWGHYKDSSEEKLQRDGHLLCGCRIAQSC